MAERPLYLLLPFSLPYLVTCGQSLAFGPWMRVTEFLNICTERTAWIGQSLMHLLLEAEELAWLVRDNLHSKHLVLSIEELFLKFVECPLSEEGRLALEPMESYQRMLLHHLADLFGLAHESIGEGEERHLVIEKCEKSSIPALLVSGVLSDYDRGTQLRLSSRQLLKRDTNPTDGSQTPPSSTYTLSLEERKAAYLAARQRIFPATWKYAAEPISTGIARPRADPAVAQRIIAHALGKNRLLANNTPAIDLPSAAGSVDGGVATKTRGDSLGNEETTIFTELKESMQQSSAKAAKRMFAKALSSSYAGTSPKVNVRHVSCATGTTIILPDSGEDTDLKSIVPSSISRYPDDTVHQGGPHSFEETPHLKSRKGTRHVRPGGAACRIFTQALGLPDPASGFEINRPTSNPQGTSFANGCKSYQRGL